MASLTALRRMIPLMVRQEIRHKLRSLKDLLRGDRFSQATGHFSEHPSISLVQSVRHSAFYDNKIINITRGAALLNHSLIQPGQQWSFWHKLGRPDAGNGFVAGRNLVNGELVAQSGGGLCQLSSMVYHLALLAGLTITERHAHSIDIYEEHQCYTPLGADATVVWGFKDLRISNPHPFALSLSLAVEDGELYGEVNPAEPLTAQPIEFIRIPLDKTYVQVNALVNGRVKATTTYEQRQGLKTKQRPVKAAA